MLEDIIDQIFLSDGSKYDNPARHIATSTTITDAPTVITAMSSADTKDPATCPVDHKSREAWLEKAKAVSSASSSSLPPSHPPVSADTKADSCPVDHSAREVWIQQARAASTTETTSPLPQQQRSANPSTSSSSWSSYIPRIPFLSSTDAPPTSSTTSNSRSTPSPPSTSRLGVDREVSTIPRTSFPTTTDLSSSPSSPSTKRSDHAPPAPAPANNEQETGADGITGNWIYPSERMFFEAMKRKGHDPRAADMRTVVPIHNAVNERAWAEIKGWEGPWIQGSSCDGPRLHSFSGLSTQLSPRARINTLLGYQAPFDRHDWVVDRCGKEIEYVIDFYAGRSAGGGGGISSDGKLSFYLDVRPKLNSWEGVKMRAFRAVGLA